MEFDLNTLIGPVGLTVSIAAILALIAGVVRPYVAAPIELSGVDGELIPETGRRTRGGAVINIVARLRLLLVILTIIITLVRVLNLS